MPQRRGPILPKHPIQRPATITVRLGDDQVAPRTAIKVLRKSAGYSRQSLSVTIGRSRDLIRHWEHGMYCPSVEGWIDAVQACGYRVVVERAKT